MWFLHLHPHIKTLEQKLMSLLHNSTKLNQLLQIHALIIKTSFDRNNFILAKLLTRIFVSSPSSHQNIHHARSLFDSIPSPDTFIWNTIIRAYFNLQPRECLTLFFQMLQEGVGIDRFTLSIVLQACGRLTDDQIGSMIHICVFKLGFDSDLFVSSALIEMYAKFDDVIATSRILSEMTEPDLVCYNVLLVVYVHVGAIDLEQKLFDKMPIRDLVAMNTMIHEYGIIGNVEMAKNLFDQTRERDLVSWSSMIAAYSKNRHANEALQLANVMPDKVTMVSVLSACGDMGALGMGKLVHEFIDRARIEVDLKLGTSLVDMYAKCGENENHDLL